MIKSILRLWLAAGLILAASAALILSDRERPRGSATQSTTVDSTSPGRVRSIALFQHVSQVTMEEGVRGVLAGLAEAGYKDGTTLQVHRFNAEGDAAAAIAIAQTIISGDDELVITLSTPSLQALAAANRESKRPHVFGMVTDPVVAGVGIARDDPKKHPPYMVGIGTMQPVAECFQIARQLDPRLATVGLAWNPSEANSEALTKVARRVTKELGIELLEATVDSSASVREAVASLAGRGAEAIWIGGDNTVLASLDAVIGPARAARIPVFTNIPGSAARGTLFDLGADYYRVGQSTGRLAGRVLDGASPEELPIQYEVPPNLWINRVALNWQRGDWSIPAEVLAKADVLVEEGGPVRRHPREEIAAKASESRRPSRTWKVGMAGYSESTVMDDLLQGFHRGLDESGLVEARDYTTVYRNAQGDIATLNALFDELVGSEVDLVVSISTPALQTALRKVQGRPLVFAGVLDPIAAGAGKSDSDHRANLTGAYLPFPYAEMARAVRQILPRARRIGTLFAPGEVNSVLARQRFEEALKTQGLELVSLPVNGPTDVSDTALTLCQSGIDVICQISDNLSNSSFPAIARSCETARMPLFTFSPSKVKGGAVVGVGTDFSENGREAGLIVAEVIRGKDPGRMSFKATNKITRSVNLDAARRLGLEVPAAWVKAADQVIPAPPAKR
jgi:ABC-type uncharacterized transport system substrate-binding protein